MRNVMTVAAIFVMIACSTGAQQAVPVAQSSQEVAARVGERAITAGELDQKWRQDQPSQQAQAFQALYDGRRAALNSLLSDMLIAQAAKAKGQTPEVYQKAELASRVAPVTDADIAAFHGENATQMQGRGLPEMRPLIREFLEGGRRTTALAALVADLRKSGPAVRVFFDAPRQQVAVGSDDPSRGSADAPVTIVAFSDFQCPFCQRVAPTLKRVRDAYGDRVRIVWKDFPLTSIHPQAFKAAEAAQCAREQGKFWEYHDRLFGNQQALQVESLKKYAADAGLDAAKFGSCLDTARYAERVQAQMGVGAALGVNSTPAVFINGRLLAGAQPYETFVAVIDEELERAKK